MEQQQGQSQVTMIDTDGNAVFVPTEQAQAQLKKGYQYGTYMTDPDNNTVVVGHNRLGEALQKKYRVGPASQQNLGKPPEVQGQTFDENGIPKPFTQPNPSGQDVSNFVKNLGTAGSEVGNIIGGTLKSSIPSPFPPPPPGMENKFPDWYKQASSFGPAAAGKGIADAMITAGKQSKEQFKNKQYLRSLVSAASAADPFAAPSVSQINELEKQGKGDEAAIRGGVDAFALAAGGKVQEGGLGALSKIINRTPDIPAIHESLSSLLDPRAGKENTFKLSQSTAGAIRNEAARQGIKQSQFKGREGNELGAKLADDAIASHNDEIEGLAKPYMNDRLDMKPIADAARAEITDEMRNNAPELVRRIEKDANSVDRYGTLEEVNDFRKRMNEDLNSYYKKGTSEKLASGRDVAATEAMARTARQIEYDYIGNKSGVDPKYIRDLANRESDLIDVRNDLNKRVNDASSQQSKAVSKTLREKLAGVKGVPKISNLKSGALESLVGMDPVDVLNERFKTIFGRLGDYQPSIQPPAPGGTPPIGPNRPQLPPGQYAAGPSPIQAILNQLRQGRPPQLPPGQYPGAPSPLGVGNQLALPASTTQDIPLHQPSLETPNNLVDAARVSGRDPDTGQFKRFYGSSPRQPIDEQPQSQYPGVLQRPTNEGPQGTSPQVQTGIIQDLQNALEKQKSTQTTQEPSKLNSPETVEALNKQTAQKMFNKPYESLNFGEKMAVIRESTKVQQEMMKAEKESQAVSRTLPNDFRIKAEESINGTDLEMRRFDGKIIGTVGFRDSDAFPGKQASEISDIKLDNAYVRKGYGQALYEQAAKKAAANGDDLLVSSGKPTASAKAAWERLRAAHPAEIQYLDGRYRWDLSKFKK